MHYLLSILLATLFLFPSFSVFATAQTQRDVLFIVLGKTSNHRQSLDSTHSLLNYHFFAEIFLLEQGVVAEAKLFRPGESKSPAYFEGDGPVLELHGGRYRSERELNEEYADGEYVFSYALSDGTKITQTVLIENGNGDSRIPEPITIYLSQAGQGVSASHIDPEKDLTVTWSAFASGNADAQGIVDDLMFVVTGNCHGEKIDHSGGPFGSGDYLTYASTEYVIAASKLDPGETFQLFVEQAVMDTGMYKGIPQIATYAATTFLDFKTMGEESKQGTRCPLMMPAMDGGQTDRSKKTK